MRERFLEDLRRAQSVTHIYANGLLEIEMHVSIVMVMKIRRPSQASIAQSFCEIEEKVAYFTAMVSHKISRDCVGHLRSLRCHIKMRLAWDCKICGLGYPQNNSETPAIPAQNNAA